MAVSLPTVADVRKFREQATHNVAEQAGAARTPILAVLGLGDLAVTTVTKAATSVRARATERAGEARTRAAELPERFTSDELRKVAADIRVQAGKAYEDFAQRGEATWTRFRTAPQVEQALSTLETYSDKLDARVDELVDDTRDAAEKALATVSTRTRSIGERAARTTQRFGTQAATAVTEATEEAAETVADAGAEVAETISDAGDAAAKQTRSTTRKAANRTAPKAPAAKTGTTRKITPRTNGSAPSS